MKLTMQNISALPERIVVPNYDRSSLKPGIMHIGVGNFHRAHQAWYLHRLLQKGLCSDWAILGGGVRDYDRFQRKKLAEQDYLYTLIELDETQRTAEVVGSLIDYIEVVKGNGLLISKMSDPQIRIVSLTVTEGGYYLDPATNEFDLKHEDIQYDAANPGHPATVFGAIVASLRIRRDRELGPITLMSCDNLQGNGDILKQTILGLAGLIDGELANWIDINCTFPNSMVDCIVPATGERELKFASEFGLQDKVPVTHENYRQWVIEDKFCAGRPDWEKVGVTLSNKVDHYETMKIRVLNAGHQLIANCSEVLGIETIAAAMKNKDIVTFFKKTITNEVLPHIIEVDGIHPKTYLDLIQKRFSNPQINDSIRRVAFDGSSRHPGFILPSIRDQIRVGGSVDGLALSQAFWARMCAGLRENGSTVEANDPMWVELQNTAKLAKDEPSMWIRMENVYGNLLTNERFMVSFERWLKMIWDYGVEETLKSFVKGDA